jgi:hypothetical protein
MAVWRGATELGCHKIKKHLHPLPLDASGGNYLLDFFLYKMVEQQPFA